MVNHCCYELSCILLADNVYGLLPISAALKVSVWLMVIHQFVAFALVRTPLDGGASASPTLLHALNAL